MSTAELLLQILDKINVILATVTTLVGSYALIERKWRHDVEEEANVLQEAVQASPDALDKIKTNLKSKAKKTQHAITTRFNGELE